MLLEAQRSILERRRRACAVKAVYLRDGDGAWFEFKLFLCALPVLRLFVMVMRRERGEPGTVESSYWPDSPRDRSMLKTPAFCPLPHSSADTDACSGKNFHNSGWMTAGEAAAPPAPDALRTSSMELAGSQAPRAAPRAPPAPEEAPATNTEAMQPPEPAEEAALTQAEAVAPDFETPASPSRPRPRRTPRRRPAASTSPPSPCRRRP